MLLNCVKQMLINSVALIMLVCENKDSLYIYFSLLLFLDYCVSNPNYTLVLNVSSQVLVEDEYVLAGEEVTLIATASNSSNFTDLTNQSQVYYYNFQCRSRTFGGEWYPINCSEESTAVEVWYDGGEVECLVQLLTQDNITLACDKTQIKIVGT